MLNFTDRRAGTRYTSAVMNSRLVQTAIVALAGGIVGSCAHLAGVAGPGSSPPPVSAQPPPAPNRVGDTGTVGDDQSKIVAAVKRVEPSVVALDVVVNGRQFVPVFEGSTFGQVLPYHEQASGSGFVYSNDGLIVTNAHVVQFGSDAKVTITVVFLNGDRVPARVYAANPQADLALVKVDNYHKLPSPLRLGHSSEVEAGQWAIAVGEPFALEHSVSVGVVSGFDRTEIIGEDNGGQRTFKGLLQTSAPINPGNSGGPLVDYNANVIGIDQSTASPKAGAQGIGFAIPADTVRQQVALLEQHPGQVNGPPISYIGVSLVDLNDNLHQQLDYRGNGVVVEGVFQGSPADKVGLQPGDVIQQIGGKDVTSTAQVQGIVQAEKPGQTLSLEVWRGGRTITTTVTVGTAPPNFSSG